MPAPYASGKYSIAICDRCRRKRPYQMLGPDGNTPSWRVCQDGGKDGCRDVYNPNRLPARQTETITLQFPRPDVPINVETVGIGESGTNNDIYIITEEGFILEP